MSIDTIARGLAVSDAPRETVGTRLRRLADRAAASNPVDNAVNATATMTADGTSDTTNATAKIYANVGAPSYAASNAVRWRGGVPSRKYNGSTDYWMGTPVVNIAPVAGGNWSTVGSNGYTQALNAAYSAVEFWHEGRYLQVEWLGNGIQGGVFYIVNGQYQSLTGQAVTGSTNNFHHLDFGSRALRRIMVEWSPAGAIRSLACDTTGSLSPVIAKDDFSVAVVGDSVAAGLTPTTLPESFAWPVRLMHLMGWPDVAQVCIGGTGYINAGSSTAYGTHMIADMAALNAYRAIGAIVFWGSTNDKGQSQAAVQSAALACYQAARSAYPAVPIFVLGSTDGANNLSAQLLTVENGVAAAVASARAAGDAATFFVPVSTAAQPWILGTGHTGALTGIGNADYDISSDATHPEIAGHMLVARRAATGIAGALQSLP